MMKSKGIKKSEDDRTHQWDQWCFTPLVPKLYDPGILTLMMLKPLTLSSVLGSELPLKSLRMFHFVKNSISMLADINHFKLFMFKMLICVLMTKCIHFKLWYNGRWIFKKYIKGNIESYENIVLISEFFYTLHFRVRTQIFWLFC